MGKRLFERATVALAANIISGGKTYSGLIDNVSECGIGYLLTFIDKVSEDFIPSKRVKMSFQAPSGETVLLTCRVKWFCRAPEDGNELTLGMQIIEPPSRYREYIKKLFSGN